MDPVAVIMMQKTLSSFYTNPINDYNNLNNNLKLLYQHSLFQLENPHEEQNAIIKLMSTSFEESSQFSSSDSKYSNSVMSHNYESKFETSKKAKKLKLFETDTVDVSQSQSDLPESNDTKLAPIKWQSENQRFEEFSETYEDILNFDPDKKIDFDEDPQKSVEAYAEEAFDILTEYIAEEKRMNPDDSILSIKKPKFKPSTDVWFQRWRSTHLYLLKKDIQRRKTDALAYHLKSSIDVLEKGIDLCEQTKKTSLEYAKNLKFPTEILRTIRS